MRSSSAEVSLSPLSAFTGTAPAVSPTLLFAVILLSSRVPVLSELKVPYPQRAFSSFTASSIAWWSFADNFSSSPASTERMSTSIEHSAAITFTDVPPFTTPTLKVVFGFFGVWRSLIFAIALPIA